MPKSKQNPKQKPTEMASFLAKDGATLVETTFDPERQPPLQFEVWKEGHPVAAPVGEIPCNDGTLVVPPADRNGLISKGVVLLPSNPAEYGSQAELLAGIIDFIHRYADIPPFWEEIVAHYILMSWVYDRFSAVPYLRFLGEPQSGKTRCLQVASHLAYRAIIGGGSTTASPFFRLLEVYRGTFAIDEADYKTSDLWAEIIKILNNGYMRGMFVLRSSKDGDDYEPRAFDVYGPKILTTRKQYEDQSLETRCLTLRTTDRKIRPDVPRQLPPTFKTEALELRNKLLRWRFENYFRIQTDESQLLALEPRLTQIGAPLYAVSQDDGFRAELLKFLGDQADEQHAERPQTIVAEAIRRLLVNEVNWPATLTVKEVAEQAADVSNDWGTESAASFTPKRTGGLVRSMGFPTGRTGTGYQFFVAKAKLADLVARYRLGTGEGGQP
jgi:hypothetical protein